MKLEEERQALAAFVSKFDALGLGSIPVPQTKLPPPPTTSIFAERHQHRMHTLDPIVETESPIRLNSGTGPSLLEEEWDAVEDVSFEIEKLSKATKALSLSHSPVREVFGDKENIPV